MKITSTNRFYNFISYRHIYILDIHVFVVHLVVVVVTFGFGTMDFFN